MNIIQKSDSFISSKHGGGGVHDRVSYMELVRETSKYASTKGIKIDESQIKQFNPPKTAKNAKSKAFLRFHNRRRSVIIDGDIIS